MGTCGLQTSGRCELFQKLRDDLLVEDIDGIGSDSISKSDGDGESVPEEGVGFADEDETDAVEELLDELLSFMLGRSNILLDMSKLKPAEPWLASLPTSIEFSTSSSKKSARPSRDAILDRGG